ncbi:MAG TPA: hypothetical protein VEB66_02320 [Opitutaceae bacterium]|nr:hypothetical protein [Opitutaceae bacterium]
MFAAAAGFLSKFAGGSDAPDTLISGFRDVHSGGINVGSKVVGSGSASTSLPSAASPGLVSSAAGSGVAPWHLAVLAVLAVVALAALLRRPRS